MSGQGITMWLRQGRDAVQRHGAAPLLKVQLRQGRPLPRQGWISKVNYYNAGVEGR